MPPPEPLVRLVAVARRRLWASRLVGEATLGLGVGAAGAAAVWGVSRVVVFAWADGVALALVAVAVISVLGWWVAHRPSSAQAALWADHRLGGEDRLSTAWELSRLPALGEAGIRQTEAAGSWAAAADPRGLRGEYPSGRMLGMASMLGMALVAVVSAVLLAVSPSLTDRALAESRMVREVVDREVEAIETLASRGSEELSQPLTELAERLSETQTLEEALSELTSARLELEERLGPNRLAESTALTGLTSRLSRLPVGQGDDPAARLADLASSLSSLTAGQRQALAQELADRAADFAGINDELGSALEAAAAALSDQNLDPALTSEALERASEQISSAQMRASEASSQAAAAAQLAEAEERLRRAQEGAGPGQDQGSGQGEGQGQGQGQGEGAASGGGGGGQTGTSGVGQGSVSGVGDDDAALAPHYSSSIFEPPAGGLGEEVHVPIEGSDPGEVVGSAAGPSVANAPLVSYAERFAEYRTTALESLQRRPLPSHLTEVVQNYFTELEP